MNDNNGSAYINSITFWLKVKACAYTIRKSINFQDHYINENESLRNQY